MTMALKATLPNYVKFTEPRGGFYIWLTLPENVDSTEILKIAIEKGAVFVVGQTFDPDGLRNNAMRISYCNTSVDKINTGVKIISDAIREVCG
jgi:DNA-binding transcriptional MocR family regulator